MIFADYKTHYCYNAYMDCGKNSDGKGLDKDLLQLGKPTSVELTLEKLFYGSHRNITV